MITNPHMLPKVVCEAMMQIIGGKVNGEFIEEPFPCSLRIGTFIGIPCAGQDTVVGAHLPIFGKGKNTKVTVVAVAAACLVCHDLLDDRSQHGRVIREKYTAGYYERLMLGNHETIARWIGLGLILIPKGRIIT